MVGKKKIRFTSENIKIQNKNQKINKYYKFRNSKTSEVDLQMKRKGEDISCAKEQNTYNRPFKK